MSSATGGWGASKPYQNGPTRVGTQRHKLQAISQRRTSKNPKRLSVGLSSAERPYVGFAAR
jgi:hypothetical protein